MHVTLGEYNMNFVRAALVKVLESSSAIPWYYQLSVAAPAKKAVRILGIIGKGIENKTENTFVFC